MKLLPRTIFLPLTATLAIAQSTASNVPNTLPNQAEVFVQSLYTQVMVHHPMGIPSGDDERIFKPYLSKSLLHKFAIFNACAADWDRQNANSAYVVKPPFGIYESGIFSGGDEKTEPSTFHVEQSQPQKDGTVRVYVKLTLKEPGSKPWIWYVTPILRMEDGHLAVDDVVYLKDGYAPEYRLSKSLSTGCDGPHWVGDDPNYKQKE